MISRRERSIVVVSANAGIASMSRSIDPPPPPLAGGATGGGGGAAGGATVVVVNVAVTPPTVSVAAFSVEKAPEACWRRQSCVPWTIRLLVNA